MRLRLLICFFFLYAVCAIPLRTALRPTSKKSILPTIKGASHVHVPAKPHFAPNFGLGPGTGTGNIKQPAKSCKCVTKRSQGPVQLALRNTKASKFISSGNVGRVFETKYEGKKAVIKITRRGAPGGSRKDIEHEVENLKAVGQFFAWGRNADNTIFYIIMHDMGRPYHAIKPQIPQAEANDLIKQAIQRYQEEFHMVNEDMNGNNFVFQKVGGVWRAEIIDWARAEIQEGAHIMGAGNPEIVEEYDPDDHDQGCSCVIA